MIVHGWDPEVGLFSEDAELGLAKAVQRLNVGLSAMELSMITLGLQTWARMFEASCGENKATHDALELSEEMEKLLREYKRAVTAGLAAQVRETERVETEHLRNLSMEESKDEDTTGKD